MATTTIPWGDGSGDNIYLTYPSASGSQTVEVTSDANTGVARTKTVTFTSGVGSITQILTVNQAGASGLIYQLPAEKTGEFDTGVKLFDTPKSFTIYLDTTFKNYSWTGNNRLIGLNSTSLFGLGRIASGRDHSDGEYTATATRYTAVIMNSSTSDKNCSSCVARTNGYIRRQFAITYNATTRRIAAFVDNDTRTSRWYNLSADLISDLTLKVLVGISSTGTIHDLKVYNYCMTDAEALALVGVQVTS
jgi:hypothetical protein